MPDPFETTDPFFETVYDELKKVASHHLRRFSSEKSLQTTDLVNETYLRIGARSDVTHRDRSHYLFHAARAVRHVLIDRGRRRGAAKRGGDAVRLSLIDADQEETIREEDALALDHALSKLEKDDPMAANMILLRFFGGLTVKETAEVLGVSDRTLRTRWQTVRPILRQHIETFHPRDGGLGLESP